MYENKKKITFPSLSMVSLNQIKDHLLELLPKFIFIVNPFSGFVAVSDANYFVSFFNQSRLLHTLSSFEILEENYRNYVIPIMIEIGHEFFSHLKSAYGCSTESPILHSIKGQKQFLCPDGFENESGYFFEFCLCEDIKELKHLKTPNKHLFQLSEVKYWIDVNFSELRKYNKYIMETYKKESESFSKEDLDMFLYDKRSNGLRAKIKCVF